MQLRDVSLRRWILVSAGLLLLAIAVELLMGRRVISKSHRVTLWARVNSPELSQQVADIYSFTHVIHGIGFYGLMRLMGRGKWPVGLCLVMAMLIECSWEVLENTPFAIERYRRSALAAGYYGDTILNSMCDILSCAVGFAIAARFRAWVSVAIVMVIELTLLIVFRDNLTLNILNLIHPIKAIQEWQSARGF